MTVLKFDPLLFSACLLQIVIPLVLFLRFARRGRPERVRRVRSSVSAARRARDVVATESLASPDILLGDFLARK